MSFLRRYDDVKTNLQHILTLYKYNKAGVTFLRTNFVLVTSCISFTFFSDFQLCVCNANHKQYTDPIDDHNSAERVDLTHSYPTLVTVTTTTKSQRQKGDCNRPTSWATTAKGETRDFYRILGKL